MSRAAFHVQVPKSAHILPVLAAGFVVLVLAAAAVSAVPFAEWFDTAFRGVPSVIEPPAEESAAANPGSEPRSKARCRYCGVIESTRQVGGRHEVTVRLPDRTTQVLSDSNPANWRPGERVILIGGGNSPRR